MEEVWEGGEAASPCAHRISRTRCNSWGAKLCKRCHKLIVIKNIHTSVQTMPEHHKGEDRTALILIFFNTQSQNVICSYSPDIKDKVQLGKHWEYNTIDEILSFNLLFECSTTDLVRDMKDLLNPLCPLSCLCLYFCSGLHGNGRTHLAWHHSRHRLSLVHFLCPQPGDIWSKQWEMRVATNEDEVWGTCCLTSASWPSGHNWVTHC